MKLPWNPRKSLLARMNLLTGVVVTIPLLISGMVLSLSGGQIVRQSGDNVAKIGADAVEQTTTRFNGVAERKLHEAATKVADIGRQRVKDASQEAVSKSKEAFARTADQIRDSGGKAVSRATDEMVGAANNTLKDSFKSMSNVNHAALNQLSENFVNKMNASLESSGSRSKVKDQLQKTLLDLWQTTADARGSSLEAYVRRAKFPILARLEYPVRLIEGTGPAKESLEHVSLSSFQYVKKNDSGPEVVRVVLVTNTGAEEKRLPETEDSEDWANSPVREHLAADRSGPIEEPIQYDPVSKHWIRRLAHPLSIGQDPLAMNMSPDGTPTPKEKVYPYFLVVDFAVDGAVSQATRDALSPGTHVYVAQGETGKVISSELPPNKRPATLPQDILDHLPKVEQALAYRNKPLFFTYIDPMGKTIQTAARFWETDACWSLVTQPEPQIYSPVEAMESGIFTSWKAALDQVKAGSAEFVKQRNQTANEQRQTYERNAKRTMQIAANAQKTEMAKTLREYEATLRGDLNRKLSDVQVTLSRNAGEQMTAEAATAATATMQEFKDSAAQEAKAVSATIGEQTNEVTNRANRQIFANSAWLIPLFLILALFLATLTARSLVKPINQLVKGTQSLAAGDYSQRIKVHGEDELARLAGAFNVMANAVQVGQAQLQQSNEVLAEEKGRIQGIVDCSPDGLVMLEPGGSVAFMNPTAVQLLDFTGEILPPAPFAVAQLPEAKAERLRECLAQVDGKEGVQEYEINEPERRVLQLREVQLCAPGGRSLGRLLHIHDITRERVIDEMKSDFISLVSHELRTPLTSILGFSSYMLTGKMGEVKETQKMALESIHRQAKRLSAIISDFLDVSRIESGKIEMKKEPVAVPNVAGKVVEDLRPQANEKGVRVAAKAETDEPTLVALGDDQRIAQVFTNLVGNALKFTEANGSIDVLLSRQNGDVLCRVKDSGCGIPPDELDRVFDRFYQVEKVVTRKSGGTGLGLAIVKNIVEAHGGRIWIESELDRGTTVSFTLPSAES